MSNVFMTMAWHGHKKHLDNKPLVIAVRVSRCITFFEYSIQAPADQISFGQLPLP